MAKFENPAAFFLLLLIPTLFFLRYLKLFSGITFPLTLGDWNGNKFSWRSPLLSFLIFLVHVLEVASYICVVIAVANPVSRHQDKVYSSRGSDVIFVVDISPSMAARDIAGMSRLEAAQHAMHAIAGNDNGNSFGLVEMAREAALIVPPTMDRNMFFSRADGMLVGEMGDGTAIGTGLSTAVYHLDGSDAPKKAIVLITDGENNAGELNPHTVARLAQTKGIMLFVLGLGTKGAVPLEYADPKTGRVYSGYLMSEYDTQELSLIAAAGGDVAFDVETVAALTDVVSSISKNVSVAQSYRIKNYDIEHYRYFLFLAACCYVVAWVIRRLILKEVC